MTTLRRTAVVVVNYGSSALLQRTLAPLTRAVPELSAVVVDNFSTTAESERLAQLASTESWTLVPLADNRGFGAGVNAGVEAALRAGCDTLVLLNPDASLQPEALAALGAVVSSDPTVVVSPTIRRGDGTVWFRGGALDLRTGRTLSRPPHDDAGEVPWISGACLAISSLMWERIGGFDERYFLYWEDVDLSYRILAAGGRLLVADDIEAVHDEGGTQQRPDRGARRRVDFSRQYYFFNIRNRLLFAELHLDAPARRSWYRHSVRESYRILLRGIGKRQFLPPWRPIALAARALRDGHRVGRAARRAGDGPTGTRSDTPILGDHVPPRTHGPTTWRRAAAAGDPVVSGATPDTRRAVRILGTHGVPAAYGGFETAAENVALHLRDHGWRVIVYCQESGTGALREDVWRGIERVIIPVRREGWLGTSEFDLRSILHAVRHRDVCLTFGYNTAVFNVLQRIRRIPNVVNMDGIEWSRARWGKARQAILWTNERIACVVGDHLIADHPSIERYLSTRARASKISTITYGANAVDDAPDEPVRSRGLEPGEYFTLICRPIPENSILELVTGFSAERRGVRLAVLGSYDPDQDPYHRAVQDAASDEVVFLGSVYDPDELAALRFHSLGYLHGHTVGGTNPSLVEAMAAGNPVIAHDNEYNRWVAGEAARYFRSPAQVAEHVKALLAEPELRARMSAAARERHRSEFTWEHVAGQYEALLDRFAPQGSSPGPRQQIAAEEGTR